MVFDRYGGPEVLRLSAVDVPESGAGRVRVRVKAASVNPFDIKLRRGDFAQMFPVRFPATPGIDVAGTVDAVGPGVSGVAPGDDVLGAAETGSYAHDAFLAAPVRKPSAMSWDLAAALPTIGETTLRALGHLHLVAGETLLIHGAADSVGAIATQLAVARGAIVIGSVGERYEDRARALGAITVRYGEGLAGRVRAIAPGGVDAVLDTSGHGVLPVSIDLAGGALRVVTIADQDAAKYGVRFTGGGPGDSVPGALQEVVDLVAAGKLDVTIWRSSPLAEAARAHADLEAGANRGKVVLVT